LKGEIQKMQKIEWIKDLSVGVELIDDQHRMLIKHLNNLTQAIEQNQGLKEIGTTLGFLIDYTDFHFSEEEGHMQANEYPGLEDHRVQHDKFKGNLKNLEEDFLEEGATQALASSIDTLLVNWLVNHIRKVDVEFGEFLKSKGISLPKES
jgi:hemerythrin